MKMTEPRDYIKLYLNGVLLLLLSVIAGTLFNELECWHCSEQSHLCVFFSLEMLTWGIGGLFALALGFLKHIAHIIKSSLLKRRIEIEND